MGALFTYVQQVERLLRDTRQELLNPADLIHYVNVARGQVAGDSECIRLLATIPTVVDQRNYDFNDLTIGTPATSGIQGIINIRAIRYAVASGYQALYPRNWEWFDLYCMNNPVPESGAPQRWAQYGQGSAGTGTASSSTGSFYVDPIPDIAYTLTCDCVCYPIALTTDTSVEALPYLWTDAVPFYAAYYACMTLQQADKAESYFERYKQFTDRARKQANPSLNRYLYPQSQDPTMVAKLGLQQKAAQG